MKRHMTSIATVAAERVASRLGYRANDPLVIQETNNTVVWLRPHAVIAKVGTRQHSAASLSREHAVAASLPPDAPIARPISGIEPALDEESGFVVTLWERLENDLRAVLDPRDIAGSLRELHAALRRYRGELPSFLVGVDFAREVLANDEAMEALDEGDRSFLRAAFDQLRDAARRYEYIDLPLHGEPHDRNLLLTPAGPRWIDLEAVCSGPLEWDLAFLPEPAVEAFPEVDVHLLQLLRALNSARVATWCWSRPQFPELRWHAEFHLDRVRHAGVG
jgi:hypothetical protein